MYSAHLIFTVLALSGFNQRLFDNIIFAKKHTWELVCLKILPSLPKVLIGRARLKKEMGDWLREGLKDGEHLIETYSKHSTIGR